MARAGKSSLEGGRLPLHPSQPQPEESHWTWLEIQGCSVRLLGPTVIDLGGIAKGFAVDQAVAAMRRAGAARGLVNAGGDLFGFGPGTWTVTVVEPRTRRPASGLSVHNQAGATSAIIDGSSPHLSTGGRWVSVTVLGGNACDADALTKIAWTAPSNLSELLGQVGASAFGIRSDGKIENIHAEPLAA